MTHPGTIAPLLRLGFRPFYLAGAVFAALALPLWMLEYTGLLAMDGYLAGLSWHVHEMLFGFAPAVIAGFLFTAVRTWTGRPTPAGGMLAAFVALWIAGRILVVTGPGPAAVAVDVAFLPAVAVAVAVPILNSGNRRNVFVVAVLGLFAVANLCFHLDVLGVAPAGAGDHAVAVALDLLAILMAVIAGRVIPAFTANAVPDAAPRRVVALERAALGLLVAVLAVDGLSPWLDASGAGWGALFAVAAVAHAARLVLWSPWVTRRQPLLWILPLSYAWLPVALALRAAATLTSLVAPVLADHALVVGAMAGLMLAMMTRSALGHTGRALRAGRAEVLAYGLIQGAAVLRVVPPLVAPATGMVPTILSAVCWSAAFALFAVRYLPILSRPRIDGKPG